MTITDDDVAFSEEVLAMTPGSFLGGSYLVHGREANDIDVVIPHRRWRRTREALHGRIHKVQAEVPTEDEDRPLDPDEDDRLVCVYRRGHVDLIVVADDFVDSYRRACDSMKADPERFAERPARVAIHVYYADEVRVAQGRPTEAEIKAKRRGRGTFEYEGGGAHADPNSNLVDFE